MTFTKSWRILFLAMLSFALVAAIACGGDDEDAPAESAAPAAKARLPLQHLQQSLLKKPLRRWQ